MLEPTKYTPGEGGELPPRPLGWLGVVLTLSVLPALWLSFSSITPIGWFERTAAIRSLVDMVPGLAAWSSAGLALITGVLAWSLRSERSGPVFRGAGAGLIVAAVAEVVLAWKIFSSGATPAVLAEQEVWWLLARLGYSLAPLGAGWVFLHRRWPNLRLSWFTSFILAALGSASLLWAYSNFPLVPGVVRPWEFIPAVAFAAIPWLVTRPVSRFNERPFLVAMEFGVIPHFIAQLHAAWSPMDGGGQWAASFLRLLALAVLFVGLVIEHWRVRGGDAELSELRRSLERQRSDLDSSQRRLSGEIQVRKEMEAGLRMLRKAVETTQLGITLTDTEGKILYTNPAQAQMYGCEPSDLIGRPSSIFGPRGRRRPLSLPRLAQLKGFKREGTNVREGGEEFPVRLSSDAVRDTDGLPVGVVTICEDISEQRQVEEELERRGAALEAVSFAAEWFLRSHRWEESLDQLLAELGNALAVSRIFVLQSLREDGQLVSLEVLQEWHHDGVVGIPLGTKLPAEGEEVEELRRHLRTGRTWAGHRRQLPEGMTRQLEGVHLGHLLLSPVFAGEEPWGVIGLSEEQRDREWTVSEMESLGTAARILGAALVRQGHEEALRQSEERFRDLFENASDLIQSVDLDGRFQYVNRSWLTTLGYTEREVSQLTFQEIVAPDQLEHCQQIFHKVISGETIDNVETVFLGKRGERVIVEGSTSCFYKDGVPVATRGIFHNITERREVEHLKSEFIAMVSHELRTPLTSIYASLQLLSGGTLGELPPQIRQLVEIADKNSRRLVRLVEDIIDVERIESGQIPFRWQRVDMRSVAEQGAEANRAYAERFGVTLNLEPSEEPLPVRIDVDRSIQVLTNLLANAVKFSPAEGVVVLRAFRWGDTVKVEVQDQGPGIPEDFREKVFQRFVQVDSVHTRSKEGSGLGLSIARSIVHRLGGSIDFRDVDGGPGTIFFLELPLDTGTKVAQEASTEERSSTLKDRREILR